MEYLTYDEYKEIGGTLEPAAFKRYSARVFSRIRTDAQGRIDKMSAVPDEVKALCRDLVEYYNSNDICQQRVSSESQAQGGTSESISYEKKTQADMERDVSWLIADHLASVKDDEGTPLLYWGCS